MTMLTDVDIGSGRCASPRTTSGSTTTTTATATSTPSATWPSRAPSSMASRRVRSPPRAPRRAPSKSSRMDWWAAECCSTSRAFAACPGSSRASMSSRRISRRRSAIRECEVGDRRHPARPHGSRRRLAELEPWDTRDGEGRACTPRQRRSWPNGRSPRSGRTATTTPPRAPPRASPFPFTCWRSTRWAFTCSTTCSSRTSRGAAKRWALGVPVCGGSAADRRGYRLAAQPDRDLLSHRGRHARRARGRRGTLEVVGEPRWPMAAAVLTAMVLTDSAPRGSQRALPAWLSRSSRALLLVALIAGDPGAIDRRSRLLRAALDRPACPMLVLSALCGDGPAHRRPDHRGRADRTRPATCSPSGSIVWAGQHHRLRASLLGARRWWRGCSGSPHSRRRRISRSRSR